MRKPRSRAKPLAEFVEATLDHAMAAQGFAGTDIILSWPEIVGERLAGSSHPIRMQWPRRGAGQAPGERPDPATLIVRCEGAFALELQHLAPLVVERVNAVYGWRCVGRIVIKQGPVPRPAPPPPAPPPLSAEERARLALSLTEIESDALRDALGRLGGAVVATERRGPAGGD